MTNFQTLAASALEHLLYVLQAPAASVIAMSSSMLHWAEYKTSSDMCYRQYNSNLSDYGKKHGDKCVSVVCSYCVLACNTLLVPKQRPCFQHVKMKPYPAACSFTHHSTKGSSAAISLASWDISRASLQLALLHQPLHPALPAMHLPELQDWQGPAFVLEEPMSAAEGAEGGAQRPAANPAAVSTVIQAWHPTGILFELVFYAVCALRCIKPTISLLKLRTGKTA